MNLLHYDDWKDTDAVKTLIYFLDTVVTDFLTKLEADRDSKQLDKQRIFLFMEKAYHFAKQHRALGLGALGWHSYLQSRMIAFESKQAAQLNYQMFKDIQDKSYQASAELAMMFGEPEMLIGNGRRNTTLNAIAPTTSSAFILGQVSQSIEPIWSNCYVKDIAKELKVWGATIAFDKHGHSDTIQFDKEEDLTWFLLKWDKRTGD
jgi:ribonucleoside-diphosphate reductase alpha chain